MVIAIVVIANNIQARSNSNGVKFFNLKDTPRVWYINYSSKKFKQIKVNSSEGLLRAAKIVRPGQAIIVADGVYNNLKLNLVNSGTRNKPIIIRAENPGKAIISGDSAIAIDADYNIFAGFYFKNGNRNPKKWKTHSIGIITIYGDYNRVTDCAINNFDKANSAWIVTYIKKFNEVPQFNRVDHNSFTEKLTFDQVVNFNNYRKDNPRNKRRDKKSQQTVGIYSRLDHNYFSNPKKPGNAGGGVRIGYFRESTGRCVVDSNVFERQDSEAEIITSKSQENVYYNNSYKNCQGTMNFRHGDNQYLIGNYLYSTDRLKEYGGLFIWGKNHVVANNYFSFAKTIRSRGNAAVYINAGVYDSEHATGYKINFIRNIFIDNNGYDIETEALYNRRGDYAKSQKKPLTVTSKNIYKNNIFIRNKAYNKKYKVFYRKHSGKNKSYFDGNIVVNPNQKLAKGFVSEPSIQLEKYEDSIKLPVKGTSKNVLS